jgi:hypothetical protein
VQTLNEGCGQGRRGLSIDPNAFLGFRYSLEVVPFDVPNTVRTSTIAAAGA